MSFIDHLEALRWHVIRAAISVVVFATIAFFSKNFLFHTLILGPSRADFWTYRMFSKMGALFGSAAITTRGLGTADMGRIVELIDEALTHHANDTRLGHVRRQVNAWLQDYPLFA